MHNTFIRNLISSHLLPFFSSSTYLSPGNCTIIQCRQGLYNLSPGRGTKWASALSRTAVLLPSLGLFCSYPHLHRGAAIASLISYSIVAILDFHLLNQPINTTLTPRFISCYPMQSHQLPSTTTHFDVHFYPPVLPIFTFPPNSNILIRSTACPSSQSSSHHHWSNGLLHRVRS